MTGSPCVGKTSAAGSLAGRLKALHVDLAEIVKKENLILGEDEKRQTLIADLSKVSRRLKKILEDSETLVIVNGHYAMDVVPAKDVRLVFVLRRHPEELKRFMEQRGFRGAKLWENLAVEILDVCLYDAIAVFGESMVCEVDCTGKTVEETVDAMIAVLNGEKPCRVGVVDWLCRLEVEGRLGEFLKDF